MATTPHGASPGIAPEPRDRVLVHEPVAAVDLQRIVGDAVRELARVELRHRRGAGERLSLVLLPGGLVAQADGLGSLRNGSRAIDRFQ